MSHLVVRRATRADVPVFLDLADALADEEAA